MTTEEKDYLFDLQGYLIIDNALTQRQLKWINDWIDAQPEVEPGMWLGHVEVHTYQGHDGINFQNIIEGGEVFEELVDNPAWIEDLRRYICHDANRLSLNEVLLNVRGPSGFIGIHGGGHTTILPLAFRHHTGQWIVGQINILMALSDIGPGDGATVVVPGSHKSHEIHPVLRGGKQSGYRTDEPASEAMGTIEVHLRAGQALMFTDAIMHGAAARTNPGERRILIYRYSPHYLAPRFYYVPSEELMARLTPTRREIVQPVSPRMRPGRVIRA